MLHIIKTAFPDKNCHLKTYSKVFVEETPKISKIWVFLQGWTLKNGIPLNGCSWNNNDSFNDSLSDKKKILRPFEL